MDGGKRRSADGRAADRLVERHFARHDEDVADLSRVDVVALDPTLRALLFTDGTVTRALEAQTLCRVEVDVIEQSRASLSAHTAALLHASPSSECICRRIAMSISGSRPSVWAESHIIPDRLPSEFVKGLDDTPYGIGGSIEQTKLESRRELLWFRMGMAPGWAGAEVPSSSAIIRLYRIITSNQPALLICEAFAVERDLDMYRPLGWKTVPRVGAEPSVSV